MQRATELKPDAATIHSSYLNMLQYHPETTLERLHHEAHERCFIANSVTTEIAIEPR